MFAMRGLRFIVGVLMALALLSACNRQHAPGLEVGEAAPHLKTKTLSDVGGDITRLTTYRQPDERMYQYSLDRALATGKPIFLEFATPGHCTPCDRQLQMIKSLQDKYEGQVIFIHLDQYQSPEAYIAYGVFGDPWTFVIDGHGIVQYQQAGSMLYQEMEAQIQRVLPSKSW
jgi:thiol-disulfide isomerase/thioredoxin